MEERFLSYLSLLDELSDSLERLSDLSRQKIEAVRRDDLIALDQVLNQEQAMALSLRGLEQKRLSLLSQLGLKDIPLSGLVGRCPDGLKGRAKQTADRLLQQYQIYQGSAQAARTTLECNMHELGKTIAELGGGQAGGAGYRASQEIEPPKPMKTDFRA